MLILRIALRSLRFSGANGRWWIHLYFTIIIVGGTIPLNGYGTVVGGPGNERYGLTRVRIFKAAMGLLDSGLAGFGEWHKSKGLLGLFFS